MAYRLKKSDLEHLGAIRSATEALAATVDEMQSNWADASGRWQESDRGCSVQDWLTRLEDQLREIADLADEIEGESEPDS